MASIRLLQDVAGTGPVEGSAGDVLDVDSDVAAVWADGVRAERVVDRSVPMETTEARARPVPRRG